VNQITGRRGSKGVKVHGPALDHGLQDKVALVLDENELDKVLRFAPKEKKNSEPKPSSAWIFPLLSTEPCQARDEITSSMLPRLNVSTTLSGEPMSSALFWRRREKSTIT
jgi:hypothetical protein